MGKSGRRSGGAGSLKGEMDGIRASELIDEKMRLPDGCRAHAVTAYDILRTRTA
jgi:hypothetical protein